MRINEYPKATTLPQENVILTDGSETGTKAIGISTLATQLLKYIDQNSLYAWYDEMRISVEDRRKVYRGKNLGDQITPEQQEAIRTGLFTDLFIGDYWLINEVKYLILDFDYYWDSYETDGTTTESLIDTHHVTVRRMGTSVDMQALHSSSTIPSNGYAGLSLITTYLPNLVSTEIAPVFGSDNLLTIGIIVAKGISNGKVTAYGRILEKCYLPSVYTMFYSGTSVVGLVPALASENTPFAYCKIKQVGLESAWYREPAFEGSTLFSGKWMGCTGGALDALPIIQKRNIRPVFNIQYGKS